MKAARRRCYKKYHDRNDDANQPPVIRLTDAPSEPHSTRHDDPYCNSSEETMEEDQVDGSNLFTRRAIRWRQKSERKQDNYVERKRANLFMSIRRQDVEGIKKHLKEQPIEDPTRIQDEYAVSVLEHAVRSGSTAVVDELLSVCETPDERRNAVDRAMLFAIHNNDVHMVAHLVKLHKAGGWCRRSGSTPNGETAAEPQTLERQSSDDSFQAELEKNAVRLRQRKWSAPRSLSTLSLIDNSEFSQEMTPIVMAAQLERIDIIRLLLDECCPEIHPLTQIPTRSSHNKSSCYVCREQANFVGRQSIEDCRKAIEVYKALSTPAYMFQAGVEDPILEAFFISNLMERRKIVDPAFVTEYEEIATKCRTLTSDLLSLCRTRDEVEALLQHNGGIEEIHAKYHAVKYPRLMVATHFNQKEFIAHPNCQQVLQNLWYKGLPEWVCQMNYHMLRVIVYLFLLVLGMPVILLLYMFRIPFVDKYVRPPISKFLFDIITYVIFLVLLFINASLDRIHVRGAPPTAIEGIIMVWLAGYTLRFIRMSIRRRGLCAMGHNLSSSSSDMYVLISILFFWAYFGLKLAVYGERVVQMKQIKTERYSLPWYDPFLWCEAFYAVACAIAVLNLYAFFKASSTLGPLQVSLKSMLFDVARFLALFVVILSAYGIALSTLYAAYKGSVQQDPVTGDTEEQTQAFEGLAATYKTLFWDLFGYGDPSNADVVVSNLNVTGKNGTMIARGKLVRHSVNAWVGFILYGTYHLSVIVVLVNMLIAMMANSYNNIEKNSITEWRFARTRLIMRYVNELGVLVPPFNLLPIRYLLGLLGKRVTCWRRRDPNDMNIKTYKMVMESVAKRYWRCREHVLSRERSQRENRHGVQMRDKTQRSSDA